MSSLESVLVESDDISVEKKYQPSDYEVPTVHFRIAVDENSSSVQRIVLVDKVPESLRLEDVGVYSSGEYHGDKWEIESTEEIRFPIQLRPGEVAETIIAFQASEGDLSTEDVLSEPVLMGEEDLEESFEDLIDGELIELETDEESEAGVEDEDNGTGNAGEDDQSDDVDNAESSDEDHSEETTSDKEEQPAEMDTEAESAVEVSSPKDVVEDEPEGDSVAVSEDEIFVRRLVNELENDTVPEELRLRLRDQLLNNTEVGEAESGSLEARIEHLQSDVTEIVAYKQSIKHFIDVQDAREDRLEQIEDELHATETLVSELQETSKARDDQTQKAIIGLSEEIEETHALIEELQEEVNEVREIRAKLAEAFDL